MKPGWIRIFRKITDCDWYWDKPFDRTHAFLDLLLLAAWEEKKVIRNRRQITLHPGEIVTNMTELGERWGMERRTVARLLDSLVFVQVICLRKNNAYTLISITNWNRYQQNSTTDGTTDGTADGAASGGTIGGKEERRKNIERETSRTREASLWQEAERLRALFPRRGNLREDCAAIVGAIESEADKPGASPETALALIRRAVEEYAAAVARWPEAKRQYIASCKNWFKAGRYHESPEMWQQYAQPAPAKKFNILDESTWR